MYSIFKVPIGSHRYKFHNYDEAIFSSIGERDLVYMYIHASQQVISYQDCVYM